MPGDLTQLAEHRQEEPLTEYRYCSDAVIVDIVAFIADIFQPSLLNHHDPAPRWREYVELWITRDQWKLYGQKQYVLTVRNHMGALDSHPQCSILQLCMLPAYP